jgi:hypothetical protein
VGCSKELFANEVKRRFGHNLRSIAAEIEYPLDDANTKHLADLQKVILSEGRYPFLSDTTQRDIERRNQRAVRFWDDTHFSALQALYRSVQAHVACLDQDSGNPASFFRVQIDHDGYYAFRCGGNLPPRMTVKYSSLQRKGRKNNQPALKRLITGYTKNPLILYYWDVAAYRSVKY